MSQKKKWNVLTQNNKRSEAEIGTRENVITLLLENRGIKTDREKEHFFHPKLEEVTLDSVEIDTQQVTKAITRIQQAILEKQQTIVFGDYDVDGITGTAILWETLYSLGATVMPYIPNRVEEGYGLSLAGVENIISQYPNIRLIITVDNGIVAHEAVTFANAHNIDVIITDHHTRGENDPDAYAIVHTTKLCGAAVGYLLAKQIKLLYPNKNSDTEKYLDLVALATVADLVPLTGANRTLIKFGLEALRNTKRLGLLALYEEAGIEKEKVGVYEIGHIIGPRLNAMGRMASAMDSLRLLCTKDMSRAKILAEKLGKTNKERQLLTQSMVAHALKKINEGANMKPLLFLYDELYEQGVIGLVASKLVETYYRPSIVLSKGEVYSKASARSISGFNIIEFILSNAHLLVNAGGHPMAAGFTVETNKLPQLQEAMELLAQEMVTEDMRIRVLKIDCQLPLELIAKKLYAEIKPLSPFGMANPEPIFMSKDMIVQSIRLIGAEKKHLKLVLGGIGINSAIDAIAFGFGELFEKIIVGDIIAVAYVLDENVWKGKTNLQLKIKDIQFAQK